MFDNLKAKLKGFVNIFSKKLEEEPDATPRPADPVKKVAEPDKKAVEPSKKAAEPVNTVIPEKKKAVEAKEQAPFEKKTSEPVKLVAEEKKAIPEAQVKEPAQKKGIAETIVERFSKTVVSQDRFDKLFGELDITLLESNVAVEVIDKIKQDLSNELVEKPLPKGQIESLIRQTLRKSISSLFTGNMDLVLKARQKKPFVILFLGINGSGKTTTIAKVAHLFQKSGLKVVMAAGDTFRAAAIQQLEEHANRLGIKMIKQDYGSDPAAVAFDAIKYAEARGLDVVLVDTAGRLHSNVNLMDELKKIVRVAKPDLKLFVGESITGNDCVEQARAFNESIGIDAIILSKADVDDKGGAAISVSYITGKPIIYLGTGQGYDDLKLFNANELISNLGLA